jgi:hypothetical protein
MTEGLTKMKAIRECKKLWEEIAKLGLSKDAFFQTEAGKKWRTKGYWINCPLCEYTASLTSRGCQPCPLTIQFGKDCYQLGFHEGRMCEPRWFEAIRKLKE